MNAHLRLALVAVVIATLTLNARAQTPAPILQEPQTLPLWEGKTPGALGSTTEDIPTLTLYMPPVTTGPMTAVIIAPGGGYRTLSMNKEGRLPANYLNTLGIAAFVLKYRLGPRYHHPIELGDIQRAIRTLRARAAEWHIDPARIGVMGFSAGGHLASTASTHFDAGNATAADPIDRASSRPDFVDSRLSRDHADGAVDAPGIENHVAGREGRSGSRPQPLDRHDASRLRRRQPSCFIQTPIPQCPSKIAFTISSRCGKRACLQKCTSSRTARMESAWRCRTPRCRSGRRFWRIGSGQVGF